MPKEGTATDFGGGSVSRLKVGNAETPAAIGFFLLNRLNRLRESQERKAEAGAGLRRPLWARDHRRNLRGPSEEKRRLSGISRYRKHESPAGLDFRRYRL